MPRRTEQQNIHTQPPSRHKIFNNWEIVTQGWYILCLSRELGPQQVLTRDIAGQKICVFRDSRNEVHAMDGFCPHMGVDLGIGKVVNDRVQCFFHHWEYAANGKCEYIPIQSEIPKKACLETYASCEKYGFIWVHPDKHTQSSVLEVPALEGLEVVYKHDKSYFRKCHFHITMINGIDPQHLSTVHRIHMHMEIQIEQAHKNLIEIELTGKIPESTRRERIARKILGENYSYAMKYADGCVAALTVMKNVKFFGKKGLIPELYMIFAYKMIEPGQVHVQPIFLTKKRQGLWGALYARFCLFLTRLSFRSLQGEDGQVYDNIRFSTRNLLGMDAPVARYIKYINQLTPSKWSQTDISSLAEADPQKHPQRLENASS